MRHLCFTRLWQKRVSFPGKIGVGCAAWKSAAGTSGYEKGSGVEASPALGSGPPWAVGMALAGRLDEKGYRVYALLGDGEIQEGMMGRAMAGAHYRLDNLVVMWITTGYKLMGHEPGDVAAADCGKV